jgi:hypothetical protein
MVPGGGMQLVGKFKASREDGKRKRPLVLIEIPSARG